MTGHVDTDPILDAFLAPDHDRLPDRVLGAALTEIARTPQRGAVRAPWRILMSSRGRLAGVALAAAAAIIIAGAALLGSGGRPVASPTPSAPTSSPSPSPSPSPATLAPLGYTGGGTIEFTRHDASGNDVLWTIDPSGANATRILEGGCCGLFSPDGRQLALAAPGVTLPDVTRDPSLIGVEILDAPGHVASIVPSGCGACAMFDLNYEPDAWSPDGRYIALTMWSDTDPMAAGMALADRDGSFAWSWEPDLRATGFHADIPLGFSPDSSQLLFMRTEQIAGPTSIGPLFVLGVDDHSVRKISPDGVTLSANGLTQGPASWSPDGQHIVFAGKDTASGRTSIYIVDGPGAEVHALVPSAPGATSARYSPDGSLIAFDSASAGFHDLYVVGPDGGGPVNLTGEFGPGVCCAQWSPDGRAMLVAGTTSDDMHNDLFVVTADGGGVWQVTTEPNAYTGFLWGAGFR